MTHRRGIGPLLLHSNEFGGEVQSQIEKGGEPVCRPGTVLGQRRVSVAGDVAAAGTTTAIDFAAVQAGTTATLDVAADLSVKSIPSIGGGRGSLTGLLLLKAGQVDGAWLL